MRNYLIAAAAANLGLFTAASALGQCADWRARPVLRSNGEVMTMTPFDPDAAGPLAPVLVVGGNFDHAGEASNQPARNIVALNNTSWQLFGPGLTNEPDLSYVSAVTVYNGTLIAAGYFEESGTQTLAKIARWNGSAWLPLGGGTGFEAFSTVQDLTVYDGDLIAAGDFVAADGVPCMNIARWDGSVWYPLGGGLEGGNVYTLTVHNNMLIAAGGFTSADGQPVDYIAAWDGDSWQPMGEGLETWGGSLCVYNNELIAGLRGPWGSQPSDIVMRWTGTDWEPLNTGISTTLGTGIAAMTVFNGELVVGGGFSPTEGAAGNNIMRWNGSLWQPLGTGTGFIVESLSPYNGQLVVGGSFETAGPHRVESIAKWNGTNWLDIVGVSLGPGGDVMSMTPWAGGMVIGGQFLVSNDGVPYSEIMNLAHFDGRQVRELADLSGGSSWITAMATAPAAGGTEDLIVGGFIQFMSGVTPNNIARLNGAEGATWQAMGNGFNSYVSSITHFNGSTYAGGRFTASGVVPMRHLSRWNGSTWVAVGPGTLPGVNEEVMAMKGFVSGPNTANLVIGGRFTSAGLVPASRIVMLQQDTVTNHSAWITMGAGFNGAVHAIEILNGVIYAGGDFTASGSTSLNHIAKWDGSAWAAVGGGVDGPVRTLKVSNNTLVVGGEFQMAGAIAARHLARWNGSVWAPIGGHTDGPVSSLAVLQDELHVGGQFIRVRNGVLHSPIWARFSEHGAPWIVNHPQSAERPCGANFAPDVDIAQGYGGLSYQWRKDGVPLVDGPTGTGSTIIGANGNFGVIHVSQADEGEYDCVITNGCGEATSLPATLTILGHCLRGDANCDGEVNNFDIDPFVLALTNPSAYAAAHPDCTIDNADVNMDGAVNNFDIDPFVALITGG
ncbi:MAG: hypothetical protein JNG88_12920 [Phycisphaerales bacterium]|nr:hypothetical protein [Phycisphaerales bacterium]